MFCSALTSASAMTPQRVRMIRKDLPILSHQGEIANLKHRWMLRQAEIDKRKAKNHEPH